LARKNVLTPFKLNGNTPQSLSADFTSPVTTITYGDNIAYQINITTSNSTGTFSVQGSVDYQVDGPTGTVINTGHWVDLILGGVGVPTVSAANDTILIDMNQVPFNALRLSYTHNTAGTGTCDMYIMAKMIGG